MAIRIVGLDKFAKKINRLASEVEPVVVAGVNRATIKVEGDAKMLCPTNRYQAGGTLRQSIHPAVHIQKDAVVGKVSTIMEYAMFVEFGTGIRGQITNRNKKLNLAYRQTPWVYTPDDGESFFTTIGNVAQPFLYPALHTNKQAIEKIIAQSLHTLTRK